MTSKDYLIECLAHMHGETHGTTENPVFDYLVEQQMMQVEPMAEAIDASGAGSAVPDVENDEKKPNAVMAFMKKAVRYVKSKEFWEHVAMGDHCEMNIGHSFSHMPEYINERRAFRDIDGMDDPELRD